MKTGFQEANAMYSDIFWLLIPIMFLAPAILRANWVKKSLVFNILAFSILGIALPGQAWLDVVLEEYKFNPTAFAILTTAIALWLNITLCVRWVIRSR